MKKLLFALVVTLGLLCSYASAENFWPRSYYVQAGFAAGYSNGDLNERTLSLNDTTGDKMKVYPPDLNFLAYPEIIVGTNIRFFSLNLLFQYTSYEEDLLDYEEDSDITFWRFGFEFIYNFNWPEDFQVGLGLGYSYSTLKATHSAYRDELSYRTEYMGMGLAFIANAHYYFTEHIAIVPAIKVYEHWFRNIYTSPSELCDLDPYLWQTFFTASLSIQFQF